MFFFIASDLTMTTGPTEFPQQVVVVAAATQHLQQITGWTWWVTPRKTNMTIENQPFEDVSPILTMVMFHCHVSFAGGKCLNKMVDMFQPMIC